MLDVPVTVVMAAAGVSSATASHLNAAGERRGGQIRYPKVRAEFDRLGLEAFSTDYLTAPLRDRLRVAAEQIREQRAEPSAAARAGVNPRANKFRGFHTLVDEGMGPALIEIAFAREAPIGWRWRVISQGNQRFEGETWRGDPRANEQSFATSEDAYNLCRVRFAPTDAEIDSGAFDAAMDDPQT